MFKLSTSWTLSIESALQMSIQSSKTLKHTNNIPTKGRAIKSNGQITAKSKSKENTKQKPMTEAQLEVRIAELQGQYT